ncbi:serine/arginine repetitive matrix protein 1, partial [Violaceomyces palustris]
MSDYRGVSQDQDSRFKNKEKTLLKSIKFPPCFDKKVDMSKVELKVMRPWISRKINELLGFEDDVVLEYATGLLEERNPDPRQMQISLTGFLESKTPEFMKELWELLISAQSSPGGIPAIFVEWKKEELRKKKEEDER